MTANTKQIFDACCGGRLFYFDKEDERVLFNDRFPRIETLSDGRIFKCVPDTSHDFTNLPFPDNTFNLVVYDPPHSQRAGEYSNTKKTYGKINTFDDIVKGFRECYRITNGTLIFKWNDHDFKINEVIEAFGVMPVFGQRRNSAGQGSNEGKGKSNTIWLVFYKA